MAYHKKKNDQIWDNYINREPVDEKIIGKQMDIAAQIDKYLKEIGWTQKQLAEKAGLRPSQLSKILAGDANPTLRTITNIEEALGKDILVCPEFYEKDLVEKGWIHPGQATVLSANTFQREVFSVESVTTLVTDRVESFRAHPKNYSTAEKQHPKPAGIHG